MGIPHFEMVSWSVDFPLFCLACWFRQYSHCRASLSPLVAWLLAAIVFIAIPFGCWVLKWLLPEKEIRLELLFLANALIAILGVIATVNGQTAVAGISEVDWSALGGIVVLLIFGLAGGVIAYRIKLKRIIKNR